MDLKSYFAAPGAMSVGELALRIGVSRAQVTQWTHGYNGRRPGAANCVAIEYATGRVVTRRDLRPTDWHLIWPELVKASGRRTLAAA